MEWEFVVSLWDAFEGLPVGYHRTLMLLSTLLVMKIRSDKVKKNTIVEVSRAVSNRDIVNGAERDEEKALDRRVKEILGVVYHRLYESMVSYLYSSDIGGWREIPIIRASTQNSRVSGEFLREHQTATRRVMFDMIVPYVLEQLERHSVSTETQETGVNDRIAVEMREMWITGIHKIAGSNVDTKKIENEVLTFEAMLDVYANISTEAVLLCEKKRLDIERQTVAVR